MLAINSLRFARISTHMQLVLMVKLVGTKNISNNWIKHIEKQSDVGSCRRSRPGVQYIL